MSKHIHGGDILSAAEKAGTTVGEILDFSANINPLGMPEGVREAAAESLRDAAHYPDPRCRRLTDMLSERLGVPTDYIIFGNGGADLIYRLAYALRPRTALITAPTFAEYGEALSQAGADIREYALHSGDGWRLTDGFLNEITDETDIIFICNPNNPTGTLTERDLIIKILERSRTCGAVVCVDECFMDFVGKRDQYTVQGCLEDFSNLVILRSFTKLYAMPGLRLGYMISSDVKLLASVGRAGQPWPVSVIALAAGEAALRADADGAFRDRTTAYVDAERDFLKAGLKGLGLRVTDGHANYLCFCADGDGALDKRLLEHGILIRSCGNYSGMGGDWYRVAVRTRAENERLLGAMEKEVRL